MKARLKDMKGSISFASLHDVWRIVNQSIQPLSFLLLWQLDDNILSLRR